MERLQATRMEHLVLSYGSLPLNNIIFGTQYMHMNVCTAYTFILGNLNALEPDGGCRLHKLHIIYLLSSFGLHFSVLILFNFFSYCA